MKSKPRLWVCRDTDEGGESVYAIYCGPRPLRSKQFKDGAWWCPVSKFCPWYWEYITGIKLKPGAGPVEITVPKRVRRAKK